MEDFIKDRNEAFSSGDVDKIKEYCKKYGVSIPEDEKTFLAGMHKAICNLYLVDNSPISIEQYNNSYDWLAENGYSPSIFNNGGEEDV